MTIKWDDFEVIRAFAKFREADSITINPHKLGYIQYPAGVIAFRDSNAVQLFNLYAKRQVIFQNFYKMV